MAKHILIVDDDARNIFALNATLREKGFNCITSASTMAALHILQHKPDIGVVLIDMMMPDMDGYEAVPVMKQRFDIPVIAVTAQAMPGDKEKCLAAGADGYVAKPVDVDLLLRLLKQYLY
jgi:CheY-like chemotaxis protein